MTKFEIKIKFKIKSLVTWSIFKGCLDQKQIFNFMRPKLENFIENNFIKEFLESKIKSIANRHSPTGHQPKINRVICIQVNSTLYFGISYAFPKSQIAMCWVNCSIVRNRPAPIMLA